MKEKTGVCDAQKAVVRNSFNQPQHRLYIERREFDKGLRYFDHCIFKYYSLEITVALSGLE